MVRTSLWAPLDGWTDSVVCGRSTRAGTDTGSTGVPAASQVFSRQQAESDATSVTLPWAWRSKPSFIVIDACLSDEKILARMLGENEFLSEHGVHAVSRYHFHHPFEFEYSGNRYELKYAPGESITRTFGGNSNWRGPIWLPINYMILETLRRFYDYYGDDFKIECPTGSGRLLTLWQVAEEISRRLVRLCLRDQNGRRPVFGPNVKFQTDPNFRDHIFFYEYFHCDTGRGLGASHQTGWTGLLANLIYEHDVARSPSVK